MDGLVVWLRMGVSVYMYMSVCGWVYVCQGVLSVCGCVSVFLGMYVRVFCQCVGVSGCFVSVWVCQCVLSVCGCVSVCQTVCSVKEWVCRCMYVRVFCQCVGVSVHLRVCQCVGVSVYVCQGVLSVCGCVRVFCQCVGVVEVGGGSLDGLVS